MTELPTKTVINYFRKKLLAWHEKYGRHTLPWQINKTPYKVWLSEVMLQQTQVSTVIPYFNKFINRFPKVEDLAQAEIDEVMSLWAGLGYYRRAKFLYACAQMVCEDFNAVFPTNLEDLIKLPGIGRSTAGAIMSLSMNKRAAILDGNVKRVMSRFFAIETPLNESSGMKNLWQLAEILTPHKHFAAYNQAMMDLGATCCTRHKPNCEDCPLIKKCNAYALGEPTQFPVRPLKKKIKPKRQTKMLILVNKHNQILLEKRTDDGIWPGLYSLPEAGHASDAKVICQQQWSLDTKSISELENFTHQFTHFNLDIKPVVCHIESNGRLLNSSAEQNTSWHNIHDSLNLGIPAPVKKILKSIIKRKAHA